MRSNSLAFAAVLLLVVGVCMAQQETTQKASQAGSEKDKSKSGQPLTLAIEGVECGNCARVLTAALSECNIQLQGKLTPNKDGPSQVAATCSKDCDLGACAAKVNEAQTPHRSAQKPGLALVVFAKLDNQNIKDAEMACRKIKGADPEGCKADATKGQVCVKLDGSQKVTAEDITKALKDAGIDARLASTSSTTQEKR